MTPLPLAMRHCAPDSGLLLAHWRLFRLRTFCSASDSSSSSVPGNGSALELKGKESWSKARLRSGHNLFDLMEERPNNGIGYRFTHKLWKSGRFVEIHHFSPPKRVDPSTGVQEGAKAWGIYGENMQDMLVRKVKHAFSRGWKHVDQAPRKDFYPEPRIPLLPSMQRIEKMPKSIRPRFEGYLRAVAKKEEFLANLKASEQQQHSES